MPRFLIAPYNRHSEGARDLAAGLGGEVITGRIPSNPDDVVINWGSGGNHYANALNASVDICINKVRFFERMRGRPNIVPPYALNMRDARENLNFPVFCRTRVEGRDGEGIVIAETPADLVEARLYVEAIPKTAEYRVHVGRTPTQSHYHIGHQRKYRRAGGEGDSRVWTGDSTYLVWTVDNRPVVLPEDVLHVVKGAWALLPELTFGAFDVIYDGNTRKAYVVEVNSAPMMTPKTVECYVRFFNDYVDDRGIHERRVDQPPIVAPAPVYEPTESEIRMLLDDICNGQGETLRNIVRDVLIYRNEER